MIARFFGFGIILANGKRKPLAALSTSLSDVSMIIIELFLKLSLIGVFCLITPVVAENGAKIPGSLAMVLQSIGLPVEGIALAAAVDRIFGMGHTVVNITGDSLHVLLP